MTWSSATARVARSIASCALIVAAAACAIDEFQLATGPQTGFAGDQRHPALIGTWVHVTHFQTASGLQASETIWEFRGDGSALRTTIQRNLDTGLADRQLVNGQWHVRGGLLIVVLDPPRAGTLQLQFSVVGDTLLLDSREFHRIR